MCDVMKYSRIFEEINDLTTEDTMQLVREAESKEVRDFYVMVRNYFLQQKQKRVIERNLF
ncbi:MAG: hypothetical protein UHS49_00730 [Faecalimonas sp.]|nr:hypothetical protein [Faecalimonas sp.]